MLLGLVVVVAVALGFGEPLTWYWFLLIPAVILQALFNTGAALMVARLGGAMQDVSELIPFILRISRYFCGVMYLIETLPAALSVWEKQVLSLNPIAVYIQLVRISIMQSYRQNSPGNAPYNAHLCQLFISDPGASNAPGGGSNIPLGAHCAPFVTNPQLWIAGVGWAVLFFVVGLIFFWQAESKYGRG
jgi:teichoic acid transport system permease protein